MLDRGQDLDWFSAREIIIEAILVGLGTPARTSQHPGISVRTNAMQLRDPAIHTVLSSDELGAIVRRRGLDDETVP